MQLKTVKTAADLPFKGIELVKVDNSISEVIIGGKLRIRAGSYGGMQVLTDSPGEQAKRYRVSASLDGFPTATEFYESSYEADERVRHFEKLNADVTKAQVDVVIDDAGSVSEGVLSSAPELEEIPF